MNSRNPVVPSDGITMKVLVVARISGSTGQKELSLEDQEDHARQIGSELNDGPSEYTIIAAKGKGERLDRPELDRIKALLRAGLLRCHDR